MSTCVTSEQYHGMSFEEIELSQTIPAMPDGFAAPGSALEQVADGCEARYSQVRFHGNYGLLCGQYQEFTRNNITESQVREIGWSAFGMCGWKADRCS